MLQSACRAIASDVWLLGIRRRDKEFSCGATDMSGYRGLTLQRDGPLNCLFRVTYFDDARYLLSSKLLLSDDPCVSR